jgi:methyl-accepting chemotaxis protein
MIQRIKSHLASKFVLLALGLALVPLLTASFIAWRGFQSLADQQLGVLESGAATVMDRVERNLFERYGDVQAFGSNSIVQDKDNWYRRGQGAPIVEAMDRYTGLYTPIYDLMLLVDTQGRLIAASSKDHQGRSLATSRLYDQNFAEEPWFRDAVAGKYLEGETATGTVVDDATKDDLVEKVVTGSTGEVVAYTAPVKDASGQTIAVWRNYARTPLIDSILSEGLAELKAVGLTRARIAIVDREGRLLRGLSSQGSFPVEPLGNMSKDPVVSALGDATKAVRDHSDETGGWISAGLVSRGALGYPGLGWRAIVSVDRNEFNATKDGVTKALAVITAVSIALILLLATLFGRSISQPLQQVTVAMSDLAIGRTNITLPKAREDELGRLIESMEQIVHRTQEGAGWVKRVSSGDLTVRATMQVHQDDVMGNALGQVIDNYREMVATIANLEDQMSRQADAISTRSQAISDAASSVERHSEDIANASHEASKAAFSVAEHSQEQAIALNDVANRTQKLSEAVTDVKDAIEAVGHSTTEAVKTARHGADAVSSAIQMMNEIGASTEAVTQLMEDLRARSAKIDSIVGLINGIAAQTNLLALNAAIEAARAGEHGRGFAVVADEVRKLAENSASATKDIAGLLGEVRGLVDRSDTAIRQTWRTVEAGVNLSSEAQSSLEEIVRNVEELAHPIEEAGERVGAAVELSTTVRENVDAVARRTESNAASSEEMAASASEVSDSVTQIAAQTRDQSDLADHLRSDAQQLSATAHRLLIWVGQYRLEEGEAEAPTVLKRAA